MKKQMLKSALMALAGVGLMSGVAMATPITGEIQLNNFDAQLLYGTGDTAGERFESATTIDFISNTATAVNGTGDLAALNTLSVNISDIVIDPFTAIEPLWAHLDTPTYSFDLLSLTVTEHSEVFLNLTGTGIIHNGTVTDDTFGNWSLTITRSAGSNSSVFSWTSDTSAVVPEPATMLLFGTGLAGLAGIARRKKAE